MKDNKAFISAGHAIFTIDNGKGEHFTFRVVKREDDASGYLDFAFVAVLTGPDNTKNYTYIGMLDLRDTSIPAQLAALNSLAATLVSSVNTQHQLGFGLNGATNVDFFTATAGNEAQTIDVSALVQADVNNIAAATNPSAPGDSGNSDAIAGLQFQLLMSAGTTTIQDFYRGVISQLGSQGQQAQNRTDNQNLLVQHIETGRQALSGVSLDEEATAQIKYQRAFEGAARLVTTFDEMLDTIINRMGIVGR